MPEDRSSYKIDVRVASDVSGATQTQAELKKIGEEAKIAGDHLDIGLGPDAFKKVGDSGEKAHSKLAEGSEKVELKERELKESVRAVAAQFGGLAEVGLWVNPMTAGLAAILFFVDELREHFGSVTESMIAAHAAQPDFRSFESAINSRLMR